MCNVLPDSTASSGMCFEPKGYKVSSNKVGRFYIYAVHFAKK